MKRLFVGLATAVFAGAACLSAAACGEKTENGETLTAEYYESVFQTDKYYNCTIHTFLKEVFDGSGSTTEESVYDSHYSAIIKVTEAAVCQTTYMTENFSGESAITYRVEKNGSLYLCDKDWDSSEYRVTKSPDFATVEEYFSVWFQEAFGDFGALDCTYFEKTETGYALREEKQAAFIEATHISGDPVSHIEYTFKIEDGRLASMYMEASVNGESHYKITSGVEFSDFGSTEVTVPDEVKALVV